MKSPEQKQIIDFYIKNGVLDVVSDYPINHFKQPQSIDSHVGMKVMPSDVKSRDCTESKVFLSGQESLHPANSAKDIDDLKTIMEAFDGCDLKKMATNTVFSDGNPQADIMFVGEAPGADEDLKGLPFVGQSGQLLDKIIASVGLNRTNVYISNIIPWRPPGNRPPTSQEIAICQPFIEKHIELINPKLLILVGGVAAKTLLNKTDGIMKLRGRWFLYETQLGQSIPVMATYHPAFLLRSPGQKAMAWIDMLLIEQKRHEICDTSRI